MYSQQFIDQIDEAVYSQKHLIFSVANIYFDIDNDSVAHDIEVISSSNYDAFSPGIDSIKPWHVTKIECLVREWKVQGQEVFLSTDNSMFEFTYYRGYSMPWKLSAIILRLYQDIRDGDLILCVMHVAGTRMKVKAWGVNGLSRGDLLEGMMAGQDLLSFIPLLEGVIEKSKGRVDRWIRS